MRVWVRMWAVVGLVAMATSAFADPPLTEKERAELLVKLNEARAVYAAGKVDEARVAILDIYRRVPSGNVAWNLALAEEDCGRLVEAEKHYRVAVNDPASKANVKKQAAVKLDAIHGKLGRIAIHAPAGKTISLDGVPLTPEDAVSPYVLAGRHEVSVAGQTLHVVTVNAGHLDEVSFPEQEPTVAVMVEPPPAPKASTAPSRVVKEEPTLPTTSNDKTTKWWVVGGVEAVAAGLAVGAIITYAQAGSDSNTVTADRASASGCLNGASCAAVISAMHAYNNHLYMTDGLAIGAAVMAGAGLATAVFWSPHGETPTQSVVPWISPTLVGAAYEVRF